MNKSNPALHHELLTLAIRYHRKKGTILQSMIFIYKTQVVASSVAELKADIDVFEQLLKPLSLDYETYFLGLLLFALISDFEIYLVDVVKALIRQYPKKVGSIQFKLSDILDSSSDELISFAAEEYLNRLMYKKPSEYLKELASILSVDASPLKEKWNLFVEAKARRDLGAHNSWRINETYIRKLSEMGLPQVDNTEVLMVPNEEYLRTTIKTCDFLVDSIHEQLIAKFV